MIEGPAFEAGDRAGEAPDRICFRDGGLLHCTWYGVDTAGLFVIAGAAGGATPRSLTQWFNFILVQDRFLRRFIIS